MLDKVADVSIGLNTGVRENLILNVNNTMSKISFLVSNDRFTFCYILSVKLYGGGSGFL